MENPFQKNKKEDFNKSPKQNLRVINAQNFFGKDGYDEKHSFLTWGENSRDPDVAQVAKFCLLAKAGCKIINTSTERIDEGSIPYKYIIFLRSSQSNDGTKLVLNGPWRKVLEDYQDGLIKIDFTLDELVEEARKP
ncbi:hypothetical protein [Rubrolithibacter danxiaensis]|uniref:hypothetical protein n=1 Tax=Rubrolithibacter danxiaensis TaxID=3390805 RepID=UPI003BF8E31D